MQRKNHEKPRLLFAHYYEVSSLQLFPYKHDAYVCDATASDIELIMGTCNETTVKLQQSRVFEIRNKLEHNNEEIPSAKEMGKSIELVSEVVTTLQDLGLIPVIFATKAVQSDAFDRTWVVSEDGLGREIKWHPSPALKAIRSLPEITEPQIIIPGFRIPETNEPLRFEVEEDSEYTKMWQDYPKHGSREAPKDIEKVSAAVPVSSEESPQSRNSGVTGTSDPQPVGPSVPHDTRV
jgi:hypothetical protein